MKKIKSVICLLFISTLLLSSGLASLCSAESLDTSRSASLTVNYRHGDVFFAGEEVNIFRIADLYPDGAYELCGDFKDYPVNIYGVMSQAEWKNITSTLAAYISADSLSPSYTAVTNEEGKATFADILPGMYLVTSVKTETESAYYTFESFISHLPRPEEDGSYSYNVEAVPKYEILPIEEDEVEFKVIKQWRDEGHSELRPTSVKVEILKDGVTQYNVELSAKNNWSYRWMAKNDGSVWDAVERNVPDGYTVTVVKDQATVVLTNTYDDVTVDPPETGDDTNLVLYMGIMSLSGVLLIILAVWYLRSKKR